MTTIQKRRGTAAQWASVDPVLAEGEPGFETDTGREKTGNGVSAYSELEYILGEEGVRILLTEVLGNLADLDTTAKTNVVAAINELAGGNVTATGIGNLADLNTDAKNTLVAAINEIFNRPTGGPGGVSTPATELDPGIAEIASLAEMAAGTDHSNRFATPAGVRQERLALKSEILGGAGPAVDTLNELVTLINSAEESDVITALTSTVGQKANASDLATLTTTVGLKANSSDIGALSALSTTAKGSIVGAINEIKATGSDPDAVQTAEGKGGARILVEGSDTPTGTGNEWILSSSFADTRPPGIDVDGGQVGCSLADPSMAISPRWDSAAQTDPYRTDLESNGTVLNLSGAYARVAVRIKLYDDRIDRVNWWVGEGSALNLAGNVSIVDPATGVTLSYGTVNLTGPGTGTPAATPVGGELRTYALTTSLIDLAITDVVVILAIGSVGGAVRMAARGVSNLAQPSSPNGLRAGGSLMRSAGQSGSAADVPSATKVWDLGAAWNKRPTPMILLTRAA